MPHRVERLFNPKMHARSEKITARKCATALCENTPREGSQVAAVGFDSDVDLRQ
jgi:hypothetical protein